MRKETVDFIFELLNSIYSSRIELYWFILYFAMYSFLGWIIESSFRTISEHKLTNTGFLYGFFVPIYGISSLTMILIQPFLAMHSFIFQAIILGIVITFVEYLGGLFSEIVFGVKLWDYSTKKFNFHGRICLQFSIGWTILAYVFIKYIHPTISSIVTSLPEQILSSTSTMIILYFIIDLTMSVIEFNAFMNKLREIYAKYVKNKTPQFNSSLKYFKRILNAFPYLKTYLPHMPAKISKKVNKKIARIKFNIKKHDKEYYLCVKDILENPTFLKTKLYSHHNSTSIYEHVFKVSHMSYSICKFMGWNYKAAARGGLLHDFYLYDWHDKENPDFRENKFHGFYHAKKALENSEKEFKLTRIEKDIIVKHMWPLTFFPPKYKEAFVVTLVDKFIATKESFKKEFFSNLFFKHRKK